VSSRRQARLLEQDSRKWISAVVSYQISNSLASAHSGLQRGQDVF